MSYLALEVRVVFVFGKGIFLAWPLARLGATGLVAIALVRGVVVV